MDHVMFLLFRAYFITLMTVGMMASLTEFRFGRRKLLGIMAVYSAWVVGSSLALLYFGGELLLLRLFLVTISVPATALTYWAANDTPTQAVFNYMTDHRCRQHRQQDLGHIVENRLGRGIIGCPVGKSRCRH